MKRWKFVLVCIFTGLVSFCIGVFIHRQIMSSEMDMRVDWNDSLGTVYEDIAYGKDAQQKFDLLVPADKSRKSYGMVVYFHAGGFTAGDKKEDRPLLQYFCSKGYVVAGINYILQNGKNKASVYSMSVDARNGIIKAVQEAKRLGYDINGIAIGGGSAGASLAMITAFRDNGHLGAPVKFCLSMVGGSTFEPKAWYMPNANYNDPEIAKAAAFWCTTMTGEEVTPHQMVTGEYLKALERVSACTMVNDSTCPFLGAYGVMDRVVPITTLPYLENALKEHKVKHDIYRFPNSGHPLQHDRKIALQFYNKLNEYLDTYLPVR